MTFTKIPLATAICAALISICPTANADADADRPMVDIGAGIKLEIAMSALAHIKNAYILQVATNKIVETSKQCSAANDGTLTAGQGSIFIERERTEDGSELVGYFDELEDFGLGNNQKSSAVKGKAYRLCIVKSIKDEEEGKPKIASWKIKRGGGVDTGILVIPFKVRRGDIYGDSSVGPYIAATTDNVILLATFGITKITIKDIASNDLKSEQGLTAAIGAVWRVKENWDLGLVVGADHLSGSAAKSFEKFQNKPWWAFSIGYKFTQ